MLFGTVDSTHMPDAVCNDYYCLSKNNNITRSLNQVHAPLPHVELKQVIAIDELLKVAIHVPWVLNPQSPNLHTT